MPDDHAHDTTLRLLKELAQRLPDDRRQEVLAQHDLVARLLGVGDEETALATAQDLLRDALSI